MKEDSNFFDILELFKVGRHLLRNTQQVSRDRQRKRDQICVWCGVVWCGVFSSLPSKQLSFGRF
jgi:hypothetical protein